MRKILTFLSIAALILFVSCKKEQKSGDPAKLEVDKTELEVSKDGGLETVIIKSNCYWDVEAADSAGRPVTWVSLSTTRGSGDCNLALTISANITTQVRKAVVTITTPSSAELTKTVWVIQEKGEKPSSEGYTFPICQEMEIDNPTSHNLTNAVLSGNVCMFTKGMTVTWLKNGGDNKGNNILWYCPSHTEPRSGTEADRSIHRSINLDGFAQLDTIQIAVPVKEALYGDLRLMCGARAASFTASGWEFYWSNDGESWTKILIDNAVTPGSDAVWNVIYLSIPQAKQVPAGGTFYFRFVATGKRSKTFVCISNAICICDAKAPLTTLPAMDNDKIAFTHGFDDLVESKGAYAELPIGWMRSATTGYASNYTTFNSQYICPDAYETILSTKGCYGRPGYLQVGYYDESLWTRQCIGTYTIKVGERLKTMGVSSTDAKVSLKAAYFKDFRGYDPLAKVYVKCGADSTFLTMTEGKFVDCEVNLKNLDQNSQIVITCPKLTADELAALGRGDNVANLQDYRFYIDDVKVVLTDIHVKGAEADGSHDGFTDGGNYNW